MKVLVTGGRGFIGSAIVHRLIERGQEVVVYDIAAWDKKAITVFNVKMYFLKSQMRKKPSQVLGGCHSNFKSNTPIGGGL